MSINGSTLKLGLLELNKRFACFKLFALLSLGFGELNSDSPITEPEVAGKKGLQIKKNSLQFYHDKKLHAVHDCTGPM